MRLFALCALLSLAAFPAAAFASEFRPNGLGLDEVLSETRAFLCCCRQKDEIVPDSEYERLLRLCRVDFPASESVETRKKRLFLRLDEIELYTFWAIDGYLGDLVKLQTAQGLLNGFESDAKDGGYWEHDALLTGRSLYLKASVLMLEAYRLSQLPKFEELLPLLERARDLLKGADAPDEIVVLNALGRAYADLAFADDTSEEKYSGLMEKAVAAFEEALSLSSRRGNFMRSALRIQLGNALNNLDESEAALDILRETLKQVDPSAEPNRFLALHLDIAQTLTARYVESQSKDDLHAAEAAAERALLVSNSLKGGSIVPHVRFNLAMTLFTIALERRDADRNNQAILEIEKVIDAWTFERFTDLHLMAVDTLCRFLDVQESITREARHVDKAIALILRVTSRFSPGEKKGENLSPKYREVLRNLYGRLSELYFKRALHETGERQREAYGLSEAASKQAQELQSDF